MVEVMKIMVTSSKRSHACTATLNPAAGLQCCSRPPQTHASNGDSWTLTGKSRSVSYGVTTPFSWVLVCSGFCLCPLRVCFPVLCKFWRLYGGVNGDLIQEALCHSQVCCTESLPLRQATADPYLHRKLSNPHRQVWLRLCGVSLCVPGFVRAL